jgi:pimeloyl-ACP methyl ester carboxylesterase
MILPVATALLTSSTASSSILRNRRNLIIVRALTHSHHHQFQPEPSKPHHQQKNESKLLSYETFYPKDPSHHKKGHVIGFLHGILGNKKNWRTPAKTFVKNHPDYSAFSVDLRGHGDSSHIGRKGGKDIAGDNFAAKSTVHDCADDLESLLLSPSFVHHEHLTACKPTHRDRHSQEDLKDALAANANLILSGHSFGGKVLIDFLHRLSQNSLSNTSRPIAATAFILDSIPDKYDFNFDEKLHGHHSVSRIIGVLRELIVQSPEKYQNKDQIFHFLTKERGLDIGISHWLMMNFQPNIETSSGEWKLAIEKIEDLFHSFSQLTYFEFLRTFNQQSDLQQQQATCHSEGKIVFIRAGKNPFWTANVQAKMEEVCQENPKHIEFVTMDHVGHWLHSDDLPGLLKIMSERAGLNK